MEDYNKLALSMLGFDVDDNNKYIVTIKDNTLSEKLNEFCKFAVDKGYYTGNLLMLFNEGLPKDKKITYQESNRIAHVCFYKRLKQYSITENIDEIFTNVFEKGKGKGKGKPMLLNLGGNEGNKDKRAEEFEHKLDECLPKL
ncbi:MAG: hypothetical protein J6T60_12065 [Bacteroidales bacterium]|nr:hypothetical protein [Bacteroidales bacterium]